MHVLSVIVHGQFVLTNDDNTSRFAAQTEHKTCKEKAIAPQYPCLPLRLMMHQNLLDHGGSSDIDK